MRKSLQSVFDIPAVFWSTLTFSIQMMQNSDWCTENTRYFTFQTKPRPPILYSWGETDTEEAEKRGRKKEKRPGVSGLKLVEWVLMTGLWPSSRSRPHCTSQTAGWGRWRAWSLGTAAVYRWVTGELFITDKAVNSCRQCVWFQAHGVD